MIHNEKNINFDRYIINKDGTIDEEERIEALGSFLDIIITRLEKVSHNLMEVQDFIEGDPYAKENVDKFKTFFDDIYNLIEKVGHIYDNMPTDI